MILIDCKHLKTDLNWIEHYNFPDGKRWSKTNEGWHFQCILICIIVTYSIKSIHNFFLTKPFPIFFIYPKYILAPMSENVPSDMSAQGRLKSACASPQMDQSIGYLHEETLNPWLSKMCPVKIQIRVREYAVWSESSLGAQVWCYIFRCCCSFYFTCY